MRNLIYTLSFCTLFLFIFSCTKEKKEDAPIEVQYPEPGSMIVTVDSDNYIFTEMHTYLIDYKNSYRLQVRALENNSERGIWLVFYPFDFAPVTNILDENAGIQFKEFSANYRDVNGDMPEVISGNISVVSFEDSLAKGFFDFTTEDSSRIRGRFAVPVHPL